MTYVFDLDGTLIDSTERHWRLMESILAGHGIRCDNDFAADYMYYKSSGNSGKSYLTDVMCLDPDTAETIQKEWIESIEDEEWLMYDRLYDDALPTLNRLTGSILFLTIRENRDGLIKQLKDLGLDKYRLEVLSHKDKKSDVLIKIQGEVLMTGDTEIDLAAAKEAHCGFYMLNRGFRNKAYWDRQGITSYEDLGCLPV